MAATRSAKKGHPASATKGNLASGEKDRNPEVAGFQIKDKNLIRRIDRFIDSQPIKPTRTAVFYYALEFMLGHYGFGQDSENAASPKDED